jgi:hypothetical protein
MKKSEIRIIESFQKKKIQKKNLFSAPSKKFSQLGNYSRWKINTQSIFGKHKILHQKIKKNLDFEIL